MLWYLQMASLWLKNTVLHVLCWGQGKKTKPTPALLNPSASSAQARHLKHESFPHCLLSLTDVCHVSLLKLFLSVLTITVTEVSQDWTVFISAITSYTPCKEQTVYFIFIYCTLKMNAFETSIIFFTPLINSLFFSQPYSLNQLTTHVLLY